MMPLDSLPILSAATAAVAAIACAAASRRAQREHQPPEHGHQVEQQRALLRFWFDGDVKERYAKLWFAPSGSRARVARTRLPLTATSPRGSDRCLRRRSAARWRAGVRAGQGCWR